MKKIYTLIMLVSLGSVTFVGCSAGKNSGKSILGGGTSIGGTVVKTVATVVGLILLSKLIKSVLGNVLGSSSFASLQQDQNFKNNFNESTPISSFAKGNVMQTALQLLVAQRYQIPLNTVTQNFTTLTTVGDLATFIGQNASAKSLNAVK